MDVPHVEVFGIGILVASTHALLGTIRILILWDNNLLKFIKLKTFLFITVSQSNLLKLCHITTRLNEIKYVLTIRHKMLPPCTCICCRIQGCITELKSELNLLGIFHSISLLIWNLMSKNSLEVYEKN